MTENDDDLFTDPEIAKAWKMSTRSVARIPEAELPRVRIGRRKFARRADMRAFIARNTKGGRELQTSEA